MVNEFSIGFAREADLEEIGRIEGASGLPAWGSEQYRRGLESSLSILLVARGKAGGVLGFAHARVAADEMELLAIAVHPAYRRNRVGTRLLAEVEKLGWEKGAQCIFLEVRATNSAAIAVYLRAGFEVTGRRARYYQDPPEDAVLMARTLGP